MQRLAGTADCSTRRVKRRDATAALPKEQEAPKQFGRARSNNTMPTDDVEIAAHLAYPSTRGRDTLDARPERRFTMVNMIALRSH